MLTEQDCDVAHEGYEANYATNDVLLAVQEGLALGVELGIVCEVVVALSEQTEGCFAARLSVQTIQS